MNQAQELLHQYQQQEIKIEVAQKAMEEAKEEKTRLFSEMTKNPGLMSLLEGPGVISNNAIMTIVSINAAVIEINPMPVFVYEIKDEGDE